MFAHECFHVEPGRIGAFSQRVVPLIHLIVKDLQANIGYADIVNIRKDKGNLGLNFVPIFDGAIEFATDIPTGFLYL